jgi:RNA polymerase sigma-70 factor (TIGR02957 family)
VTINGSNETSTPSEELQGLRPLLFSIAYRMTGSAGDAEDIVQDAYIRFQRVREPVGSLKAYMTTITTRLSIDHMRSARVSRTSYIGPWLPEPLLVSKEPEVGGYAEMADSVSLAFLVLLETLSPSERAVFLLREVFDYDYSEIAEIVGKSEDNCRQIFSRSKKRVDDGTPRFEVDKDKSKALAGRFFEAAQQGDMDSLVSLLASDAAFYGDGGGKARAYPKPVFGRDKVSRLVGNLFGTAQELHVTFEPELVNGDPGLLSFDDQGRLINVLVLEISDGMVHALRSVVNPDKLDHLGYPLTELGRLDGDEK